MSVDVSVRLQLCHGHLLGREEFEVVLLIELVEELAQEVATCEVLLEVRDFLQTWSA